MLLAARAVADKAKKLASHVLEAAEHDLEIVDGEVRVIGARQLSVKLGELSRILRGAPGYGFPPGMEPGLEASRQFRIDDLAYANGCHVAEVDVDVETGEVRIIKYFALQDSGRLINPMIVDGQIHGGIAHGIGNALFEWMGYDEGGQPLTTTFADYLLPTATELPMLTTLYRETPSPLNPLGVKGVGEVGTIPAAAAIISAVEDALTPFGVHIDQVAHHATQDRGADRGGGPSTLIACQTSHKTPTCHAREGGASSSRRHRFRTRARRLLGRPPARTMTPRKTYQHEDTEWVSSA